MLRGVGWRRPAPKRAGLGRCCVGAAASSAHSAAAILRPSKHQWCRDTFTRNAAIPCENQHWLPPTTTFARVGGEKGKRVATDRGVCSAGVTLRAQRPTGCHRSNTDGVATRSRETPPFRAKTSLGCHQRPLSHASAAKKANVSRHAAAFAARGVCSAGASPRPTALPPRSNRRGGPSLVWSSRRNRAAIAQKTPLHTRDRPHPAYPAPRTQPTTASAGTTSHRPPANRAFTRTSPQLSRQRSSTARPPKIPDARTPAAKPSR